MELDSVTLALPGSAAPSEQLAAAELPPLASMVADALEGRCDYARGTSVSAQAADKQGEHAPRPPPQPGPWPRQQQEAHGSSQPAQTAAGAAAGHADVQGGSPAAKELPSQAQPAGGEASGKAAGSAAAASPKADGSKAQRGSRRDRWRQRIAGVIHLDGLQQGEARPSSRPAGVVSVRLLGQQAAAGAVTAVELDTEVLEAAEAPVAEGQQQQQEQEPQGKQQLPRGAAEFGAAGPAGSNPAEVAQHSLARELQMGQSQAEPRRPKMVHLSTGGRRPGSPPPAPPSRPAQLKQGQTPFGAPQVQRALDGSGR